MEYKEFKSLYQEKYDEYVNVAEGLKGENSIEYVKKLREIKRELRVLVSRLSGNDKKKYEEDISLCDLSKVPDEYDTASFARTTARGVRTVSEELFKHMHDDVKENLGEEYVYLCSRLDVDFYIENREEYFKFLKELKSGKKGGGVSAKKGGNISVFEPVSPGAESTGAVTASPAGSERTSE